MPRPSPACPLTRLAQDHAEQRPCSAPTSSLVRAPTADCLLAVLPALGRIGLRCQLAEEAKERLRLADEQPIGRQGLERAHCRAHGLGRPNDRNDRELAAQEDGGLGHDQVGLEVLPAKGSGIEVGKHQPIGGIGQWRRIARLVMPGLKMGGLGGANTEQDAQHLRTGDPLRQ